MTSPATKAEPFPSYQPEDGQPSPSPDNAAAKPNRRASISSRVSKAPSQGLSSLRTRARTGSLGRAFLESNPPLGFMQASGEFGSKIPTVPEIRNGAFGENGWTHEGQMEHRGTNPHEIHARRVARTSSASNRTRKSSVSANTPSVIQEERHEFFPKRAPATPQQEPLREESSAVQPSEPTPAVPEQISEATEKPRDISQASFRSISNTRKGKLQKSTFSDKERTDSSSRRDYSIPPSVATNEPLAQAVRTETGPDETGTYPNGYRFPKKHTWGQSTNLGLKAYWKFLRTPFGILLTVYGLNVVAWGAMIFFVLLKAVVPGMCIPTCDSNSSAREKWIEIDSQVLTGLFCVTAFGLLPWRARDFYFLVRWRFGGNQIFHRKLAGIYRGWYRLPGSDQLEEHVGPPPKKAKKQIEMTDAPPAYTPEDLARLEANPAIALPVESMPEPPLTGLRAPPSRSWTLDAVIHLYMMNTVFQVLLCAWMWHWNRINRPAWGTGVWITFGCLVAIGAGVVAFREGVRVKKIEGIPVQEYDVLESIEEFQQRKAKEEAEVAKKLAKHEHHHHFRHNDTHKVVHSEKLKGHAFFTRH